MLWQLTNSYFYFEINKYSGIEIIFSFKTPDSLDIYL